MDCMTSQKEVPQPPRVQTTRIAKEKFIVVSALCFCLSCCLLLV